MISLALSEYLWTVRKLVKLPITEESSLLRPAAQPIKTPEEPLQIMISAARSNCCLQHMDNCSNPRNRFPAACSSIRFLDSILDCILSKNWLFFWSQQMEGKKIKSKSSWMSFKLFCKIVVRLMSVTSKYRRWPQSSSFYNLQNCPQTQSATKNHKGSTTGDCKRQQQQQKRHYQNLQPQNSWSLQTTNTATTTTTKTHKADLWYLQQTTKMPQSSWS